ncbi:MAG: hypothetical protein ACHREM_04405 [Polyangiales bacterium]
MRASLARVALAVVATALMGLSCADRSAPFSADAAPVAARLVAQVAPPTMAVEPVKQASYDGFEFLNVGRDPFQIDRSLLQPKAPLEFHCEASPLFSVAIADLRLEAILRVDAEDQAMVVAPNGEGYTLRRGDHLGRGEVVTRDDGTRSSYPLFWRVDRITDDDVILMRMDPLHPEIPASYRVLPLHPEAAPS